MMQPATQLADATPRSSQPPQPDDRAPHAERAANGRAPLRPLSWYTRLKFGAVRWVLYIWVRLFSLRGLYLLGRTFGTCEYLLQFRRRRRYREALAQIFPEGIEPARMKRIAWASFRRTRCDKLFYLIFDRLPREKIMRRIRFHGRQYIDDALARGRGVYVMLSHNGSHHVAGLLMALLGYRCAGVRDRNEGALRVYIQERYARTFPEFAAIRMLYADSFPRDIYRCFQENCVVGSALDVGRIRGMNLKTCPVRIFGEKREFLTGTLQVAMRCRATILQGFVVSRPNFYSRLIVQPALYIPGEQRDEDPERLIPEIMQRYADGIEAHVREHPDHLSRV